MDTVPVSAAAAGPSPAAQFTIRVSRRGLPMSLALSGSTLAGREGLIDLFVFGPGHGDYDSERVQA